MTNKTKYVCGTCGSSDIEVMAWVKMNTEKFVTWVNETDEDCYCPDCGQIDREVVTEEEFKQKQDG